MSDDPYRIAGPALVSFSGGRTSAFMLKHILDAHGGTLPADVRVCFANTGRELEETLTFVEECSRRWAVPIIWLEYDPAPPHHTRIVDHASASRDGEPFRAVIAARGFLPNPVARFCTAELKIRRMKSFMHHACGYPHRLNVVGLRADEMRRVTKLTDPARMARERWINACPLAEAGVTRRDVAAWWRNLPFDRAVPRRASPRSATATSASSRPKPPSAASFAIGLNWPIGGLPARPKPDRPSRMAPSSGSIESPTPP